MSSKPSDPATDGPPAKTERQRRVSAADVSNYLRQNPDFFVRNPKLLDAILAPSREMGEGVSDLQRFMIEQLRGQIDEMAEEREELLAAGRNNLNSQARVHEAVLAVLSARSLSGFLEIVSTDLMVLLDVDAVTVALETAPKVHPIDGVRPLNPGAVDRILGADRDVQMRSDVAGDTTVFGAAAGLVRSDALVRLTVGDDETAGLLAFGSRDPENFHPGLGTELLGFLGGVVEAMLGRWLETLPGKG